MSDTEFEQQVLERLIKIESKLEDLSDIRKLSSKNREQIILIQRDNEEQEKRITSIEDNSKWMWRTIVSTVIVSLIGLLFTFI